MTDTSDPARPIRGVIPYRAVDAAEKAVAFCKAAFGVVQHRHAVKHGGTVMNVGIEITDGMVMLMDTRPQIGPESMAATSQGRSMQRLTRTGDRFGRLCDPLGIAWAIKHPGQRT